MAKASGSKASRSERKAGRQRVQRARAHGLPEPRPQQAAASARADAHADEAAPEQSDVTPAAAARKSRPVLVWVLGGALMILLIAYVITKFRDSGSP